MFKEYRKESILSNDIRFISSYSVTNIDEFMAESFAMYKLNSLPSQYALRVGKIIDKYFKKWHHHNI